MPLPLLLVPVAAALAKVGGAVAAKAAAAGATKIGTALASKAATTAAAKGGATLGSTLAGKAGSGLLNIGKNLAAKGAAEAGGQAAGENLAQNLINQGLQQAAGTMFGGGGGQQTAPQAEQTPINIPQMALQNKMAEMKANTQPMQAQAVQPVQTNNNQDMLKQGLMDRLRFRRTGGIY